jgi:ribonuclease HII
MRSEVGATSPNPALPLAMPRRVLGLDEAGRGSALGPLVVGGFLTREGRIDELRELGVRDSKLLPPAERERIFRELPRFGTRWSVPLLPSDIDGAVLHRGLNLLEAAAFARLIRRARPDVAYVDACDPVAARFGRTVGAMTGTRTVVHASHHADRDLPVVGAASIVAKVLRDRAVRRLERDLGRELGSGYPSDPVTVRSLTNALAEREVRHAWIRYSWKTYARLKPSQPVEPLESFAP